MNIYRTAIISVFLLVSGISHAQNEWEDFKSYYEQSRKEFMEERRKANAEFTDYLKEAWTGFSVNKQKTDPIGILPDKPTYYTGKSDKRKKVHGIPSGGYELFDRSVIQEGIHTAYNRNEGYVSLDFFGIERNIPFPGNMILGKTGFREADASNAWNHLSRSGYVSTLDAIMELKETYTLSDWAMYQLVRSITEAVYNEYHINERVITQAYILAHLKYKVKAGYSGEKMVILLPFKEVVYQVPYVNIDGTDYAIFSYDIINTQNSVYTYSKDFPVSEYNFSLEIDKMMKLGSDSAYVMKELPLWSSIMGRNISVPVNMSYIEFTYDYPQTELSAYHRSVVDSETARILLREIRFQILKKQYTKMEALSFILNLVQNGFDYKTDYEMFGRAKPLFIEESLFYGANNCKDRVLIFSWMVRNVLKMKTVMISYPGHVACGVDLEGLKYDGDIIRYRDTDYLVCDPTYINAPIGETMPKFVKTTPEIIDVY